MKTISQIILSIALVVLLQWKGIVFTYLSSLNHPTINCTQRAVTKKIFKHFTLSNLLLSPLIHHKCCQKAITKNTFKNFTLSTPLLSPLIPHKCCQEAITKNSFKNFTLSTLLLSPLIHHKCCKKAITKKNVTLSTLFLSPLIHLKCCQKAVTKKLQKFHPFYIVTVTTNSPQPLPLLHHYFIHKYHPFSSLSVTHSHSYTSLTIKISHH